MNGLRSATWSAHLRTLRRSWVLLALGAVYLYAFPYFAALRHANELPRILTTEQLADHGTLRLDDRLHDLGSMADISTTPAGHRYQNKAPGLSLLGVVVYYPLSAAFSLAGRRPPMMLVTWALRVALATVPTLGLLGCFRLVVRRFASEEAARNGALVALALGSMAWPLGLLFMSHALAASLVAAAFAVSIATVRDGTPEEGRSALMVGALLGLSMLTEYQALFGAVLVAAYLLWGVRRRGRVLLAMAAAAAPFLAVLACYHWIAFGSPLRTGYAYSVDEANRLGVMGLVGFSEASFAQLLVRPDNGLLLLSPWVVLALVGAAAVARSAEARARVGSEALVAGLVVIVYCLFVGALYPEFGRGGWSVGPRYIAVAMPFMAWLAAAGLDVCVRRDVLRVPAFSLVMVGVLVHMVAATTYPHWPVDLLNPLFEISLRLLREGHAPHSLGTLVGLRGVASLAPLYGGVLVLVVVLLAPGRRYLLEVVLALVVAIAATAGYGQFERTSQPERDGMWQFVKTTLEP